MSRATLGLQARTELPLLVAFVDLTHYAQESDRVAPLRLGDIMDGFYELVSARVAGAGGVLVKLFGDGALIVFPEARADAGVVALLDLREEVDASFAELGWQSRLVVKAHFGPVVAGPFGPRDDKRFDVLGKSVNVAATLVTRSFALSAEAFRKLSAATRKRFKKHTPPVTYLPLDARRP